MQKPCTLLCILITTALAFSCMGDPVAEIHEKEQDYDYAFSFAENEKQHWKTGYASYPVGKEAGFAPEYSYTLTPEETGKKNPSIRISGQNHGNGLFMYLYRKIEGLEPETLYQLSYTVELASNAPRNSVGNGGSPGASVYLKAGALSHQPHKIQEMVENVFYWQPDFDKGLQEEPGKDMISLGNIGTDLPEFKYSMIKRTGSNQHSVTTSKNGELWVLVGTDSGYKGVTTLYITSVKVKATKIGLATN